MVSEKLDHWKLSSVSPCQYPNAPARNKALARLRRGRRVWQHPAPCRPTVPTGVTRSASRRWLATTAPLSNCWGDHGRPAAAYNSSNVLSSRLNASSYPPPQMLGRQPLLYRHVAEQRNCLLLMAPHLLSGNSPRLSHFPNRLFSFFSPCSSALSRRYSPAVDEFLPWYCCCQMFQGGLLPPYLCQPLLPHPQNPKDRQILLT